MDEHSREVEFGSCQLDKRLLVCGNSAVFSDFEAITGDVNDGLIMELAIIGSGDIYEILKPLKVPMIRHVCLP